MKYYENDIYPIGLVLTNNFEDLTKNYTGADGEELVKHEQAQATTYMMTRKNDGNYYAMAVGICFNIPITARLAAHEGFHAVYDMMEIGVHIPLSDYSDEAWAYMVGWVADCINDFKKHEGS